MRSIFDPSVSPASEAGVTILSRYEARAIRARKGGIQVHSAAARVSQMRYWGNRMS
jgi:hypothetical protein